MLPTDSESRLVFERIEDEFPGGRADYIDVLVSGADRPSADAFATTIATLPNVTSATVTAERNRSTLVSVSYEGDSGAPATRALVNKIRDLPPPAGAQVLVGGVAAESADQLASLASGLPWMGLF